MSDPHDDRMGRPDGHHYDAPESDEDRAGKSWTYLALGTPRGRAPGADRHRDGADLPDLSGVALVGSVRCVNVDDVRRLLLGTSSARPRRPAGRRRSRRSTRTPSRTRAGLVLLDTGIGAADEETEAWYRPRRVPLATALAEHGWTLDDVTLVVNCHLHFDHCGGNPLFAGRRVVAQRRELATARAGGYTVESLVDFAGVSYEELDGEAELLPGRALRPDARPRRRPPVAGGRVRRRLDRAGRAVPRHRVCVERRRARRAGPGARPRRPAAVVPRLDAEPARASTRGASCSPTTRRSGPRADPKGASRPARTAGRPRRRGPGRCSPCR